jgi:hypothetical protein
MRVVLVALLCSACMLASAQPEEAPAPPPPEREPEAKVVRVTAEGYNRDDALKQALR